MLLRFRGANHRSFRGEFELDLRGSKFNQGSARPAELPEDPEMGYLPAAVIYGANASGKSNVLYAMRWMRNAVLHSVDQWSSSSVLDDWSRDSAIPREPFKLDAEAREWTSLFEVELAIDDDRYVYGFEVSDDRIESEWLHAYPRGQARRQVWFERDADADEPIRFPGEGLKGSKESLIPHTRDTALFLTVANAFNHPQIMPVFDWFKNNLWWLSLGDDLKERHAFTAAMLRDPRRKRQIETLLKAADLGIVSAEVEMELGRPRVWLIHSGRGGLVALDFDSEESMGTYSWFAFIGPMLEALDRGTVILIDELDASLHPLLAAEVIRIFLDEGANPRHAQFVATVHDASLISNLHPEQPLERDQIWITRKNRDGESDLYPLTDARPRKDEPLARRYLAGNYGGVPRLQVGAVAEHLAELAEEVPA